MSLLNGATNSGGDAGENGQGQGAGQDSVQGTGQENGQGQGSSGYKGGTGDGTPGNEGSVFTSDGFNEAIKNPSVLKDGKLFGMWPSFEEAAKGISNLQGKLREKNPGAPDNYDGANIKVENFPDVKFDAESDVSKAMLPVMKEAGITQAQFEKLVPAFMAYEQSGIIDSKAELSKLGDNGTAMINNVSEHVFSKAPENLKEAIKEITSTAAGIQVLDWMLQGKVEGNIPANSDPLAMNKTSQELFDEAYEYQQKHKETIDGDLGQQQHYMSLMEKAAEKKQKERQKGG